MFGTQTTYTYTAYCSSASGYSTVLAQTAGVNGPRYTLTTLDGFGRATRVERGMVSGGSRQPQSYVDTQYAPCGCSPLGKVSKVSEAYAPGAAVVWAHQYTFDGLGRITRDLLPDGSATLYAYSGNTTTVTPPSNNPSNPVSPWKKAAAHVCLSMIESTEKLTWG